MGSNPTGATKTMEPRIAQIVAAYEALHYLQIDVGDIERYSFKSILAKLINYEVPYANSIKLVVEGQRIRTICESKPIPKFRLVAMLKQLNNLR